MLKRILAISIASALSFSVLICKLYFLSTDERTSKTATQQSSYKLNVAEFRGTIYDYNLVPLTNNGETRIYATVLPTEKGISQLSELVSSEKMIELQPKLGEKKPFVVELDNSVNVDDLEDIRIFKVNDRYSENQLCEHIIGYVDETTQGVCGLESSFDEYLSIDDMSKLDVSYTVLANGSVVGSERANVIDTSSLLTQGVTTTIDSRLQNLVENIASKYIKKGAVIISEVPNCEIRAMLSLPSYNPMNIGQAISNEDSPLVNRCLLAYPIGSIFKLVSTATAIDYQEFTDTNYNCTGSINVENLVFHCFDSINHGEINIEKAIAYSCNCYFINLFWGKNGNDIIEEAESLGFGRKTYLADEIVGSSGNLPTKQELSNPINLANFSFGQGNLTATPLQVCAMVNTIASNGEYTQPKLVQSLVDTDLQTVEVFESAPSTTVMSYKAVNVLKRGMSACCVYGTGKSGQPNGISVAGKTGTAQTGQFIGDREITHCWFAAFFPLDNPKYVVTIFEEDGQSVSDSCAKAMKEIIEQISMQGW